MYYVNLTPHYIVNKDYVGTRFQLDEHYCQAFKPCLGGLELCTH